MPDDALYGFGADDVRRIGNAVSFVERDPRYTARRPRKYPIGGGGGGALSIYRITQQVNDEDALFTRCATSAVTGKRCVDQTFAVSETEEDIVLTLFAPSITATGCLVFCTKVFGNLYAVAGLGSPVLSATVTSASIDPGEEGEVEVVYSTDDVGGRTAPLAGVTNDSGRLVQSGAVVRLIYNALQCEIVIDEVECG